MSEDNMGGVSRRKFIKHTGVVIGGASIATAVAGTSLGADGAGSDEYCVIKVEPSRVELSEMFGTMNKRVWRP